MVRKRRRDKGISLYQVKDTLSKDVRKTLREVSLSEFISKPEIDEHIIKSIHEAPEKYGFSKSSIRRMEPDKIAIVMKLAKAKIEKTIKDNRVSVNISKDLKRNLKPYVDFKYIKPSDIERIVQEATDETAYHYHGFSMEKVKDNILLLANKRTTEHIQNQIVAKRGIEELTKKEMIKINQTVPVFGQWRADIKNKIEKEYKRKRKEPPGVRAVYGAVGIVIKEMMTKGRSPEQIFSDTELMKKAEENVLKRFAVFKK